MLASNVMLYSISISTNAGYVFGAEVLSGISTGLFVHAPFSVSLWPVAPMEISSAIGFIMCARVRGITPALPMTNTIFLALSQNEIYRIIPAASKAEVQATTGCGG